MLCDEIYQEYEKEPLEADPYPDHFCHVLCEPLAVLKHLEHFDHPGGSDESVEFGDSGHPDELGETEIQEYKLQRKY